MGVGRYLMMLLGQEHSQEVTPRGSLTPAGIHSLRDVGFLLQLCDFGQVPTRSEWVVGIASTAALCCQGKPGREH